MKPAVTLVVFCYRQEKFIEQAVRSALAQDFGPLRIWVSDDCSPDRTFDVARRIVADYRGPHDVSVTQTPSNLGLMGHVHQVVHAVETDWMVWAAGDDISLPSRVSRIMEGVRRYPGVELVHSAVKMIDEAGRELPGTLRTKVMSWHRGHVPPLSSQERRLTAFMATNMGIPIGASEAWNRSVWTRFPRVDPGCTEDVVGAFRAAIGGGALYLRQPLVLYRTHSSNMWSAAGASQAGRGTELYERRLSLLRHSLDQHLVDLEAAESAGWVPAELARHVRDMLAVRRVVEECREGADPASARAIAGMMANMYFDIRARSPARPTRWPRLRGWTQLAAKLAVQAAIRRDLDLR